MRSIQWLAVVTMGLAVSLQATAETRRLQIQSKYDNYSVELSGSGASVGGKPVHPGVLKDILPLLNSELAEDCPAIKGSPDVTIKEEGKTRHVYFRQNLVTDGKNCSIIGGDGLFFFPVHRDFLIGAKRDSIQPKGTLKLFRQNEKVFDLKQNGSSWSTTSSTLLLNYDFLERFENSLNTFDVRFRALPEIGQGKTKVMIETGGKNYEFYKLGNTWAVKKPGTSWLEASDDWSFWYDLDNGVLEDRFAPQIHAAEDAKSLEDRAAALQKLEGSWSPNMRDLYHHFLLDNNIDAETKALALKRLRGKPSKETSGVLVKFLSESID